MMRYHILVNPNARGRRGYRVFQAIEPELKRRGIDYQLVYSKSSEHVSRVIRKLTAHPGIRLIVIGGDGTLSRAIDSISDVENVRVGYIPAGSGNDFWRSLKIPSDPLALLDIILQDNTVRTLDVGTLTFLSHTEPEEALSDMAFADTKRFIVSCGIGFDAAVCAGVAREGTGKRLLTKMRLAKLSYIAVALNLIFKNKNIAMEFTTDNGKTVHLNRAMFLAAMNTRYEGGGFMFAPDADPADGKLDLCVVGDVSTARFLRSFPLAYKGKHFGLKGVDHDRTSSVEVKTEEAMWVHTDGDVSVLSDHIRITCEQRKLRMLN